MTDSWWGRAVAGDADIPPDEGCDLAPSCLHCPFPRCRYDDPGLVRRLRHGTRRQEQARRLAALSAEGGWTMEEAAGCLGVSRRTAFRVRGDLTPVPFPAREGEGASLPAPGRDRGRGPKEVQR